MKPGVTHRHTAIDESLSLGFGPCEVDGAVGGAVAGAVGVDVVEAVAGLSGNMIPERAVDQGHAHTIGVVHAGIYQGGRHVGTEVEGPLPRRQDAYAERLDHERKRPDGDPLLVLRGAAGRQPAGHRSQSGAHAGRAQPGPRYGSVDVRLDRGRGAGDARSESQQQGRQQGRQQSRRRSRANPDS